MKRTIFFLFFLIFITGCSKTMPDISDKSIDEVIFVLTEMGIDESRITIEKEFSKTIEKGNVISSNIETGEELKSDADVQLKVSMGKGEYLVSRIIEKSSGYTSETIKEYDENGYEIFRKKVNNGENYSYEETFNFSYEFDSEGRVIREDCVLESGFMNADISYVYTYDQYGNETSEKRYYGNKATPYFEKYISYNYDGDRLKSAKLTYPSYDNVYNEEWVLEYNGDYVKSFDIYIDDVLYSTLRYFYNDDNQIKEMELDVINQNIAKLTWSIENNKYGPWMLDFYPEVKKLTPYPEEVSIYDDYIIGSNMSEDIIFEYKDSELISAQSDRFKLSIETDTEMMKIVSYSLADADLEYKYDANGMLISKTHLYKDGINNGTKTGTTYVYNKDGKVEGMQSTSYYTEFNRQYYDIRKYIYGYDNDGNLIGETCFSEFNDNEKIYSNSRSYTYEYVGLFEELPTYKTRGIVLTGPIMPD